MFITQLPDPLVAVFPPAFADRNIPTLSRFKVSQALELLYREYVLEKRNSIRINIIAVDARLSQIYNALVSCTNLSATAVKAYELVSRSATSGIIQYIGAELSGLEITDNLRSPQQQVARAHRVSKTPPETDILRLQVS